MAQIEPRIVRAAPPGAPVRIDPSTAARHHSRSDETWGARTYADELSERGEDPRVRVRCDCGRRRPAFAMVDIRKLPPAVRGDRSWACDGCIQRLAHGNFAKLAGQIGLMEALGAPPAAVERLRAAHAVRRERMERMRLRRQAAG